MEVRITFLSGAREGTSESFHKLPLSLGRAATCDVLFDAAQDAKVSAVHAQVRRAADGGLEVHDAGSTNGTLIDGRRVEGAARLPNHAVVELGAGGPKVRVSITETGGVSFAEVQRQTARRKAQQEQRIVSTIESEAPLRGRGEPARPRPTVSAEAGPQPPRGLLVLLGVAVVLLVAVAAVLALR